MIQIPLPAVPDGYCACGCGQKTEIASRNRKDTGWIKGQPLKYVVGHNPRWRGGPAVPIGQKWCGRCKKIYPLSEFYKHSKNPGGLQGRCKKCTREQQVNWRKNNREKSRYFSLRFRLRQKYKISLGDYEKLVHEFDGKCGICGKAETKMINNHRVMIAVDHDHITGRVRGILCNNCNRAIGLVGDNISFFEKAIEYLKKHGR